MKKKNLRFYCALFMAKLSVVALKITRHNGTNFPGDLALQICPDLLDRIDKPKKIIGVTGTNGKTTVSNMLKDALESKGIKPLNNAYGSNIQSGIATSLIHGSTIMGNCKYDLAVLEIDERATPKILPYVTPDILIITNLFRDSMKRNAHPEYIKWILNGSISKDIKLILNADDLISSTIGEENEKVYFGIDKMDTDITECINIINDLRVCPVCNSKLKYDYLRYHHIGKAYCENCGFKSPEYDYVGKNLNVAENSIIIENKKTGQEVKYTIINDAIHNIYNLVAAVAVLTEVGFDMEEIKEMLSKVAVVSSRYSEEKCGSIIVSNQMAKENNALGSSRAFDYISKKPGKKELILMMNCIGDEKHWSENVCWLYDCDFEFLNNPDIEKIVVTGPRGKDYHLRLLLAGVSEDKIEWTRNEKDAPDLLNYTPGESIFIFYGTDSVVLGGEVLEKTRQIAREKGGAK